MKVITTNHASERMEQRQITLLQVRFAIRFGTRIECKKTARYYIGQKHIEANPRHAPCDSNGLVVVTNRKFPVVITVYRDFNWKKYL